MKQISSFITAEVYIVTVSRIKFQTRIEIKLKKNYANDSQSIQVFTQKRENQIFFHQTPFRSFIRLDAVAFAVLIYPKSFHNAQHNLSCLRLAIYHPWRSSGSSTFFAKIFIQLSEILLSVC